MDLSAKWSFPQNEAFCTEALFRQKPTFPRNGAFRKMELSANERLFSKRSFPQKGAFRKTKLSAPERVSTLYELSEK